MRAFILAALAAIMGGHGHANADVVIGVAGPMSGGFAMVGQEILAGVTAAADRLNRIGGLGGERIIVESVDDRCDATTGAAVANQLVGRGAVLVVGHACTAAALPAAGVYTENDIVFITPAATNPRLTDEGVGEGIYRLAPRSDQQPEVIADYLKQSFAGRRVAFVHDGSVYGQGLAEAARRSFEASGTRAVVTQAFTPGERSQNALVGTLQDGAVDAVVIGALQADAAVVATEMRARGLDATLIGGEALGLEEFRDLAGAAAEGVVFALPEDPRDTIRAAAVVANFRAEGVEPVGATLPAYAAVELYVAAVEEAGTFDFTGVVDTLASKAFDTVLGPIELDAKGDRAAPGWRLHVWRGGAPAPLR